MRQIRILTQKIAEPPSINTGCSAACNKVTLTLFVLVFKIAAKVFKIFRVDAVLLSDLNLRSWFRFSPCMVIEENLLDSTVGQKNHLNGTSRLV